MRSLLSIPNRGGPSIHVLTPTFEAQLPRAIATNGGKEWESDRYLRAYRERGRQLSGTVGVAPAIAAR